jgi:hypothetical protein
MMVGATALNSDLRDNLNFLLNGKDMWVSVVDGSWSTTDPNWANAYSATGSTMAGRALVMADFNAAAANAASGALYRLNVNGAAFGGAAGQYYETANRTDHVTLACVATGLGTGTYTAFVQMARAGAACTATIGALSNTRNVITLVEV